MVNSVFSRSSPVTRCDFVRPFRVVPPRAPQREAEASFMTPPAPSYLKRGILEWPYLETERGGDEPRHYIYRFTRLLS